MRILLLCTLFCLLCASIACADSLIRLNSLGFLPDRPKQASIAAPCADFRVVRDADGGVAYEGHATGPVTNSDTGEALYTADFTPLKKAGVYHLDVPGVGKSASFRIGRNLYGQPFATAVQAMTLWRCGTAVHATYNGVTYAHDACHLEDAWLDYVGGGHVKKPSTRGWHDAGDYNKYVVNAGVTVGVMLLAWEQFEPGIRRIRLSTPSEDDRIPAYLREVKWELDWLLTMQADDGSVYHKVSTLFFGPAFPPEQEHTERYFAPWSSAATADFVAMLAQAARLFQPYDRAYARRCLEAAEKSYRFLLAHPDNHPADLHAFRTGGYQTGDRDDRLWAAAELWETTGQTAYLRGFETRARAFPEKLIASLGWGDVQDLGMITYLDSKRAGRDSALVKEVRDSLLSVCDGIVRTRNANGYARPLGSVYYWGCNGTVAAQAVLLQTANRIAPKAEYVNTALDALGHLFGRNVFGRSFVTGLGADPPQHPHDRRSMGQPGAPTWPGYLVGGGWPGARDWKDMSSSYQTNEIAINWNAPLIYALASFLPQ